MSSIYLDWAATVPPDIEVLEQVKEMSAAHFGNPSSIHRAGREAEKILNESRRILSSALGCLAEEILFTSGGTESNNMVLFSLIRRGSGKKVILSGIEHASVYQPAMSLTNFGYTVKIIKADNSGLLDPARIEVELDKQTALVAVMLVNNETGNIQPVSDIAEVLKSFYRRTGIRIPLHTDAVQGFCKIPFNPVSLGVDSASLSAHKIGGPRGVGALFVRKGSSYPFLYTGGGQEHGQRPGTENLPGIYGFALAAEKKIKNIESDLKSVTELTGALISEIEGIKGAIILPQCRRNKINTAFSPYILKVAFPPIPGEVLVRVLEEEGFLISTGSACSSKKKRRFRVLGQMGISDTLAFSAVRISLGRDTGHENLSRFAKVLKEKIPGLMKIAG